jgi:hypothetical protein
MSCRTQLELQAELARIGEAARRRAETKKLLAQNLEPERHPRIKSEDWSAMRALIGGLLGTAAFIRQRWGSLLGGLAIGLIAALGLLLLFAGALGPSG